MNIVLIGFRGTGKTSVSRLLARKLNRKMISIDNMVVRKAGMPIKKIVKKYGWNKFRYLEREMIKSINDLDGFVIDTGGGVILKEENINTLNKNSIIVLLKVNSKEIASRVKSSKQRPALTNKSFIEEIEEVMNQRKEMYSRAADFTINTANLSIEDVCNRIIKKLGNRL